MYGTRLLKSISITQNIEETVLYFLTCQDEFITDYGRTPTYGIHIHRYLGDILCDSCEIKDYSTKFDATWELLQKLWRNGVKPAQTLYVVEDHLS